ncbi:Uncharacterised protein [uncultured archaeon]|nr:Uncharacterised protein [uncultured archaeon]
MNTKSLIIIVPLVFIVLISGCLQEVTKEQSKEELGDEILNIGEAIPENWDHTIITQNLEDTSRPHGLWKPVAIVNFTNPKAEFEVAGGIYINPSFLLYFYDITEKQEIMEIIDKEKIYSWCVPVYFDETGKYIIVTSPCYIKSEKNYYFPLERELKEHFDKFKQSSSILSKENKYYKSSIWQSSEHGGYNSG